MTKGVVIEAEFLSHGIQPVICLHKRNKEQRMDKYDLMNKGSYKLFKKAIT